jgi:octopine/nopaline transport system permease protein
MSDLGFLADTMGKLLSGLPLTLELAFLSVCLGAALALLLTLLRASSRVAEWIVSGYVFVFRGSPLLVQLFLIYYGLGQFPAVRHSVLWPFLRQPFWCAILSLSLNTAAYGSEILRGGLRAVPAGAIEAARVCGMSGPLLYRRIILPLAIRQALPAYGSEVIIMVKSTSLASIITLMEVTGIAQAIISTTYRAFEVFGCAGAIYLLLNFLISRGVFLVERRLGAGLRAA